MKAPRLILLALLNQARIGALLALLNQARIGSMLALLNQARIGAELKVKDKDVYFNYNILTKK